MSIRDFFDLYNISFGYFLEGCVAWGGVIALALFVWLCTINENGLVDLACLLGLILYACFMCWYLRPNTKRMY